MAIEPVAHTLVVEDDANILNLLSAYLESAGHTVVAASDGDTGLQKALNETFDICVFDEMLPNRSGSDIARAMRKAGIETPVLFLSALSSEADVIRGFGVGGDDYVIKPFSPRELLVRVDAILRRCSTNASVVEHSEGPIQLADDQPTCMVNGNAVELTPHEYRILRQLLSQPNRVFERGSLIATIYGNEHAVSPKAIDVHVHHLRAKLGSDVGALIKTVRGFGYRYVPMLDAARVANGV
ncbi:MAG: response regulator transcription factor [Paracoccaceae bacterium]|nr:response regulator transcription factor [Paracoccaceae bacterium]